MKSLILALVAVLGLVASADAHGGFFNFNQRQINQGIRAANRQAQNAAQFNARLYGQQFNAGHYHNNAALQAALLAQALRQQQRQNHYYYQPQQFIAPQQFNDGGCYNAPQLQFNAGGCAACFR